MGGRGLHGGVAPPPPGGAAAASRRGLLVAVLWGLDGRGGGGDRGGKQSGAEVVGIELAKGARDARTHGAAREGWGVRLFGREMWGCLGVWRPARRGRGRGRWERGASPSLLTVGVGIALPLLIYTTGCPGRGWCLVRGDRTEGD